MNDSPPERKLTTSDRVILAVTVLYSLGFGAAAVNRANHEFVLYIGAIVVLVGCVTAAQSRVRFSAGVLAGLSAWGLLHMIGGNVMVGGDVAYSLILIDLVPSMNILRFDQVVHAFGFGMATLACHHLLTRFLRPGAERSPGVLLLSILMGCGAGAWNEILEFIAVLSVPETGVGGYENTLLDLCFNLIGAGAAAGYLTVTKSDRRPARTTGR